MPLAGMAALVRKMGVTAGAGSGALGHPQSLASTDRNLRSLRNPSVGLCMSRGRARHSSQVTGLIWVKHPESPGILGAIVTFLCFSRHRKVDAVCGVGLVPTADDGTDPPGPLVPGVMLALPARSPLCRAGDADPGALPEPPVGVRGPPARLSCGRAPPAHPGVLRRSRSALPALTPRPKLAVKPNGYAHPHPPGF